MLVRARRAAPPEPWRSVHVRDERPNAMNIDPAYLVASLVVSGVGFVLFSFGKSQKRVSFTVTGLIMLVYPYFITNVPWMLGVLPVLLLLLWLATRMGL
jgi:hypothetical protein